MRAHDARARGEWEAPRDEARGGTRRGRAGRLIEGDHANASWRVGEFWISEFHGEFWISEFSLCGTLKRCLAFVPRHITPPPPPRGPQFFAHARNTPIHLLRVLRAAHSHVQWAVSVSRIGAALAARARRAPARALSLYVTARALITRGAPTAYFAARAAAGVAAVGSDCAHASARHGPWRPPRCAHGARAIRRVGRCLLTHVRVSRTSIGPRNRAF